MKGQEHIIEILDSDGEPLKHAEYVSGYSNTLAYVLPTRKEGAKRFATYEEAASYGKHYCTSVNYRIVPT